MRAGECFVGRSQAITNLFASIITLLGVAVAQDAAAQEIPPPRAQAYVSSGVSHVNMGDYDRAIADFSQAIRLDPKYAAAYDNRGTAYLRKSDYDRAIADFTQAIQLDPKDASAYDNRGNAYYKKGDTDRAIADETQAIQLDPKDASAYDNRGNAYLKRGDIDRAIADYNQAYYPHPNENPTPSPTHRKTEVDDSTNDVQGINPKTQQQQVQQSCAAQIPTTARHVTGRVTGFWTDKEALAATRNVEAILGLKVNPAYLRLKHVGVRYGPTRDYETMAAVPEHMAVKIGDTVELYSRYRDPSLPCHFIPWTINRIIAQP